MHCKLLAGKITQKATWATSQEKSNHDIENWIELHNQSVNFRIILLNKK